MKLEKCLKDFDIVATTGRQKRDPIIKQTKRFSNKFYHTVV